MAYLSIQDFKYGMDRRRERVAGTPGTLWTLENGVINRGGDIEGCLSFVPQYNLPAGSHGMYSLNRQLYVFGSDDLAASMPVGVTYQRLESPNSGAMVEILDVLGSSGKVYAIARYDDGGIFHFYNGSRVTDWDTIAAASADYTTLARYMAELLGADSAVESRANDAVIAVTAKVPGTPFTISGDHVDGGSNTDETITVTTPQANVAAVAEALARASITIDSGISGTINSVTVGGVALFSQPVAFNATPAATAVRLVQAINTRSGITGYSAAAEANVVTISAAVGTGATPNGSAVVVATSGSVDVSADATLSGGVTAVDAVAQVSLVTFGGTFEADDTFTVTLNGVDYVATGLASATGRSLYADFQRLWSPANSLWRYCKLADPNTWNPATAGSDAGYINVALDVEGIQNVICARRYSTYAVVYGEQAAVLYQLDTDPANFSKFMVLDNISVDAARSPIRYGNNDVFHLDPSGIRSLRALNNSNAPFVSDVGNAIDTFLLDFLDTLSATQRRAAVSAIEPRDGRLWVAVGGRIFVLSYFPGAKISAWSYFSPGFEVEAFARIDRRFYVRAGNTIYLYGGLDGKTYPGDDQMVTTAELPFLSANTPATRKGLDGFDAALSNEWHAEVLIDPNREDKVVQIGVVKNKTYQDDDIELPGQTPLVALKLSCRRRGRRTISMAQIHFHKEDEG